ncbi:aldo-keto reductase family 1 member A1 [Colletes gigas]|uniref:aldo-keto reductase family 1 member A1 n=1 Tax=Colletes gigas TaxID=935657 RepID=UPI001C9BBAC6|nr:aldo-keto reductase family 1 member A1 [Colletes gigas]XP_043261125.1 aldo-keto reductase family 1 member A1 [Colletes gigas]
MKTTSILLPNGCSMPALGFGTWQAKEADVLEKALDTALEAGYRHIDTAPVYENEEIIGKVLKKWIDSGKVKRSDLFIVTKLPPSGNRPESVEKYIKKSLQDLQLEYLDLYLIHTPLAFVDGEGLHPVDKDGQIKLDCSTDHVKVWAEMEKQVKCGRTKAIGLSNFNIGQIERVLKSATTKISMLQIELHVFFQQNELVHYCREHEIPITAYSPLGSWGLVKLMGKTEEIPDMLLDPVVLEIAKAHKKTAAQILLRFIVQHNIAAIPKSTNPKRIKENIDLFDWELKPDDVEKLKRLDKGKSGRICDFTFFKGLDRHPEFPF